MKTITIILLTAAIVVVGAGGFVQIQALQQRVSVLETAHVENVQKHQPSALERITKTPDRTAQMQTPPAPPAADKPKAEPAESTTPKAVSYLDQLLEM